MRMYGRGDPDELKNAKIDRGTVRRALTFARPYRAYLLAYLGVIVLGTVIAALPPLVFKALIDRAIIPRNHTLLGWLIVAAAALTIAQTVVGLVNRWLSSRIGEGLIYDLRTKLYEHVQGMPLAFFTRTQTGSLLSRLSNDVLGAQQAVGTVATVFSDVLTLLVTLAIMLQLSWSVTLLTLLAVPLIVVIDRRLGKRLVQLSRKRMKINASMSTTMTERFNVSGALLSKLFGRPHEDADEFASRAAAVRDSGVDLAMAGRIYYGSLALVGGLGTVAVYWLGGRAAITGAMTVGTLTALVSYVTKIYSPLTELASARVDLLTALVSFERVFEVLDAPRTIADSPDAVPLVSPTGRVKVDDVWFRYPAPAEVSLASLEADSSLPLNPNPSDWILKGISFEAEPGRMVALVGPSGAGKTTLTQLIPRLYDVTLGAVSIDGYDVRSVTLASLSAAIGVVSQDPHLFHDSILVNLRYARPHATDEEIVEACRAARIHDVIAALPDGYDTIVGERGYRLSGGEKQRLAIARVLLKRPAIVILDEATSHLDSENEAYIQQALAEALEGRTSIVIAHRLSTIQAADEILVIDDGQVAERGTHSELISHDGLYRELYETQFAPA
jgi:ATP-binding cassette subfamily B protein